MTTGQRPPIGPPAFPPHGAVDQSTGHDADGSIIYIDATGPFNREMVDRVRELHTPTFRDAAAKGAFGHISTFHASMLATPDAFAAFAALIGEWKAMGILPAASAYVVAPEVEGRTIVLAHYRRAWSGIAFEVFERRDDAESWVAGVLRGAR